MLLLLCCYQASTVGVIPWVGSAIPTLAFPQARQTVVGGWDWLSVYRELTVKCKQNISAVDCIIDQDDSNSHKLHIFSKHSYA